MGKTFNIHIAIGQQSIVLKGATEWSVLTTQEPAKVPDKAPVGGKTIYVTSRVPQTTVGIVVHEIPDGEVPTETVGDSDGD